MYINQSLDVITSGKPYVAAEPGVHSSAVTSLCRVLEETRLLQ